jgi:hypothetical protein
LSKSGGSLDASTLDGWLWDAACQVRGPLDAPKFKDYTLPLIFLKRLLWVPVSSFVPFIAFLTSR